MLGAAYGGGHTLGATVLHARAPFPCQLPHTLARRQPADVPHVPLARHPAANICGY
jgi:hypothetical protein